jgi:hypothetical protein
MVEKDLVDRLVWNVESIEQERIFRKRGLDYHREYWYTGR